MVVQKHIRLEENVDKELKKHPYLRLSALCNMLLEKYFEELKNHE